MAVKFCPNCGNKVDGSSNFCPKCGYNLAEFKNKQSNEKHEDKEGDHIPCHRGDPTNNPIVEEEEQTDNQSVNSSIIEEEKKQIKSDPDYRAYKALGDSSMSFAEYKRHKKKVQTMEPIPKHEKKKRLVDTDLYKLVMDHPKEFKEFCTAMADFDEDVLFDNFLDDLCDINHGIKSQTSLSKLYHKTTELEYRLHNLNKHMEGNTTVVKGVDNYM